jgi:hypothetical protein
LIRSREVPDCRCSRSPPVGQELYPPPSERIGEQRLGLIPSRNRCLDAAPCGGFAQLILDERHERPRLRAGHAPGRKHRPQGRGQHGPLGEDRSDRSACEFRRKHPLADQGQSHVGQDGGTHTFGGTDPHAAGNGDPGLRRPLSEYPGVVFALLGVDDCLVRKQVSRDQRGSCCLKVGWRGENPARAFPDLACGQRGSAIAPMRRATSIPCSTRST